MLKGITRAIVWNPTRSEVLSIVEVQTKNWTKKETKVFALQAVAHNQYCEDNIVEFEFR